MRVAIVSLYPLHPQRIAGGMRAAVYQLVQALGEFDDLDVHVIYCHADVARDAVTQHGRATVHYFTPPHYRPLPNYLTTLVRIGRALRDIQPDVVNAHTSHYAIPGLRAGLPTLLTLHGVAHREAAIYSANVYDRLRFRLAMLYDRYTLARVTDIVGISPYILQEYAGRTRARWHRIDNPLPDACFAVARAAEPGRVFYAGTVTPLKDLLTLLKAVARLHAEQPALPLRLRLAGRTVDPAYEAQLRAFVRDNGLDGQVEFLGLLDPAAVRREYGQASLVALPSRQEVLPMVIIEAMAAGTPVVATRAGGLPHLVQDGVTGLLVDVGDDVGMAAALARLLQDRALSEGMGRAGRQIAGERFRAAAVADRYRQAYDAVAQGAAK